MSAAVAKWTDVPQWIRDRLREDVECSIDGVRWVGSDEIAFAVDGGTWSVLPGKMGTVIQPLAQQPPSIRLGTYVIEVDKNTLAPYDSAAHELSSTGYYAVAWPEHDIAIALYYMAAVHKMFGNVDWYGGGSLDPVVAKVDERIVAVVMPLRRIAARMRLGSAENGVAQ